MASFVPSLSKATDIDAYDWHPNVSDDVAPDTVRSPGLSHTSTMRIGLFAEPRSSDVDEEPPTLRSDEIGAIAPRAMRTFDPAAYVVDACSPNESGVHPAIHNLEELEAALAEPEPPLTGMRSRIGDLMHKFGIAVERFVAA